MFFYCVRHGESEYNRVGRIQGWLDVPLSPLGESQAAAAAVALARRFELDTRENRENNRGDADERSCLPARSETVAATCLRSERRPTDGEWLGVEMSVEGGTRAENFGDSGENSEKDHSKEEHTEKIATDFEVDVDRPRKAPRPQRVFASPLRRAWRTAEHVAASLTLPMEPVELLKEIQIGDFQGLVRQEVALRYPELWQRWLSFDPDVALPGGETRRQLAARGEAAFRTIAKLPYRAVVVVSHGAILTATFKSLMGIPPDHPPYALQNGSITTCELTADGRFTMFDRDNVDHLPLETQSGPGDLPV